MLRVGLIGLIRLFFCSGKKLATPLEFAEPQIGVEEGSPSVWQYLLAVPEEIRRARFCSSVAIKATIPNRIAAWVSSRPTNPSCCHTVARSDLDEGEKQAAVRGRKQEA